MANIASEKKIESFRRSVTKSFLFHYHFRILTGYTTDAAGWHLTLPPRRHSSLSDFKVALMVDNENSRVDHDVLDVMLHFSQHIGAPPVQLSLTCLPRPSIGAAEHRSTARTRTRRPRWSGQIQVSDGGQDGNVATNDNTLFMVQGVFVP